MPTAPAPKRTSAAGLTVPKAKPAAAPPPPACEPLRTRAEELALFDSLRSLRDSLPPNKNDRAVALITACISGGICTERGIVRALVHLHFESFNAVRMLRTNTSTSASRHRWSKGDDGRYRLLE